MKKKALIIMNPCSGTKRANKYLTDIVETFTVNDYICTVLTTTKRGDGTLYAEKYAGKADLITCIGGDGTFNEVVSGLLHSGRKVPIGYIPAGSTNDFANSLHLSKNIVKAARDIVQGNPVAFDIGSFNGRGFSYVASFGAFTKASYATPQNVKNALGHLAYILEGIKDLPSIRPRHVRFDCDNETFEGDYIFGAISNSTSVGGILTLDPDAVDMNDGLFELLLIRNPKNAIELSDCIRALGDQTYDSPLLTFHSTAHLTVIADPDMDWTLDGEKEEGHARVEVQNLHNAIRLIAKLG